MIPDKIKDRIAPAPTRLGGTVEAEAPAADLGEPPAPTAPPRRLSPLSAAREAQLEARRAAEAAPPAPVAAHRVPTGARRTYRGDAARRVTKLSAISLLKRGADLADILDRVEPADRPAVEQAAELITKGVRP